MSGPGFRQGALSALLPLLLLAFPASAFGSAQLTLIMPQSTAFAILGHDCGGIQEQSFPTGFNSAGYPTGVVDLKTTCSTGGKGGNSVTYTGSANVVWDFAGAVRSYTSPAGAIGPNTPSTDIHGDQLSSSGTYAILTVIAPNPPKLHIPAQSGDQVKVSWGPSPSPPWVVSSTVTAVPQGSSAPVLTATVSGAVTKALLAPLQPSTTYAITVVSGNPGGSSSPSNARIFTSQAASVLPSAPTGVSAYWTAPGTGTSDSLVASWAAASPGNSPVDSYQVTISIYDGDTTGSYSQTVSGSTLTATFLNVNDIDSWSVAVRAHNAAGWGPWSTPYILGGT